MLLGMAVLIQIILFVFPWKVRRYLLTSIFSFEIASDARIGYSIILAKKVVMKSKARIGHLTFVKRIDELYMGESTSLGTKNWVTGFAVSERERNGVGHFSHIQNRQCVLHIGDNSRITARHYFDCNGGIYIGKYVTIAGFESAFMTHSIDLRMNRQDAQPIYIGDYCFVSTRCTVIKGSALPPKSVLGACSLLNKKYTDSGLYAGVNAKYIHALDGCKYFERTDGFVI